MHSSSYLIPVKGHQAEIIIQKSRFISTIQRVRSLEEMRSLYCEIQNAYPKANHNCWAAVTGAPSDSGGYGFSDDGEPSGTAGKPILKVLQYSGAGQVGLVVTRYFGGVKLGTGGLVRAYTEAAQAALEEVELKRYAKQVRVLCTLPYDQEGTFRYLLKQFNLSDDQFTHTEKVTAELLVDEDKADEITEALKSKMGPCLQLKFSRSS